MRFFVCRQPSLFNRLVLWDSWNELVKSAVLQFSESFGFWAGKTVFCSKFGANVNVLPRRPRCSVCATSIGWHKLLLGRPWYTFSKHNCFANFGFPGNFLSQRASCPPYVIYPYRKPGSSVGNLFVHYCLVIRIVIKYFLFSFNRFSTSIVLYVSTVIFFLTNWTILVCSVFIVVRSG